jgi:hypothetical protein
VIEFFNAQTKDHAAYWNNVNQSTFTNLGYVVEFNAPEPATFLLLAPALGLLAWRRRRA